MRRDGFVSLDADADGGVVTTAPFRWEGERLYLNADAENGEIRCELIGSDGQLLEGYERSNSIPLTADGVRQPVEWRQKESMFAGSESPVQLRIWLEEARLYSYWFE